jgi:hypothetical protein
VGAIEVATLQATLTARSERRCGEVPFELDPVVTGGLSEADVRGGLGTRVRCGLKMGGDHFELARRSISIRLVRMQVDAGEAAFAVGLEPVGGERMEVRLGCSRFLLQMQSKLTAKRR